MRHRKARKKIGMKRGRRLSVLRNLTLEIFRNRPEEEKEKEGKVVTTLAKAKQVSKIVSKMISLGKREDLASRRLAYKWLRNHKTVKRLFDDIAPNYKERDGGYVRIVKLGFRKGDNAPIALVELV